MGNFKEVNQHTTRTGGGTMPDGRTFYLTNFVRENLYATGFFSEKEKMKEWLTRQIKIGILPLHRLKPLECQELHRLGYEPKDLFNGADAVKGVAVGGTAGQVYTYD